ncbi:hypothetical protein FRC15_011673 [Serendipita sp. 397]|nr:hypothetical protein FRC15_011673 [Serendipita sp. 397]
MWDAVTGDAIGKPLEGHTGWIRSVTYSPDGRHIISGSEDCTIRMWDAVTGDAIGKPLEGHADWTSSVAYSPDGRHIISGSDDCTIRMWDAETGDTVGKPLEGHTGWIRCVAYSPDGHRIISGSHDCTIRIWDPTKYPSRVDTCFRSDSDGWVRHPDGGLLFWVPEDCRNGLSCPAILTIPTTGHDRVVRLNLETFRYGSSWTDIKRPEA